MKARTRRKLEMGARVLLFSRLRPDSSQGYATALAQLEDQLTQAADLMRRQHQGLADVRAAAIRKRDLCRLMRRAHLAHLARVAHVARRELPELRLKFRLPRGTIPYLVFRTAARRMAAEAESHKEVMVRHGLADTILQSLGQSLEEFDRALEQKHDARRAHVGASAGLDAAGDEVVRIVKVLDPLNHYRFAGLPGVLAEWISLSNLITIRRSRDDTAA